MSEQKNNQPSCPLEEPECEWLDVLQQCRQDNADLKELVHTDALTGLFNHRHFRIVLDQELERSRRGGLPTALIMLDLDHFKQVNDRWGHESGNQVLKHTAAVMRQVLRKVDIACRYGGEEFAVILPGTPLPRAASAAERLRVALAAEPVALQDGTRVPVSASLGVNVFPRDDGQTPEQFIEATDRFLYQAKESGRNRIAHPDFELYKPKGQVGQDEKDALLSGD